MEGGQGMGAGNSVMIRGVGFGVLFPERFWQASVIGNVNLGNKPSGTLLYMGEKSRDKRKEINAGDL
ncbi:hypothetical protein CEXT_72351 [Caerostris extrusa]|uniref:Uncharacterized protein n=1 Tax=Caerostris extrusa TaxID=172846 RepID=A0AAV4M493_CAEEX|nr:hypothetical protein CEXT_72351 [Caerostris extrusa]